jgi:UDPglucose--hexose-1-phosphate uridylyltransferase
LPSRAVRELATQRRHHEIHGGRLLLDYAAQEARHAPRLVGLDGEWLVVVPFWAAWPYETLIVPRAPAARLEDLTPRARDALAETLVALIGRYDGLFDRPFPYSMGWHQAPFDGEDHPEWQLHGHVYPPLLRADARKFMVGYELLAEPQRDISPEAAAAELRASPAGDG